MIRFSLVCDDAHAFDGWFRSSADYERQADKGLVSCPACGSSAIRKGLMAPNVVTSETRAPVPAAPDAPSAAEASGGGGAGATPTQAPSSVPASMPVPAVMNPVAAALASPEGQEFLGKLREVKARLLAGSENVGDRFAEEARKIHYGETEARPVHGQATPEEARELIEEGVDILPLPVLPEERN